MESERPVRLVAVGDVIPTRPLVEDDALPGRVVGALGHLRAADVAFGTLETALTDRGQPWEKVVSYRSDPSIADAVEAMGFDIVSLANNQTMNFGAPGLLQTIELLEARGIRHVGAGRTEDEAWAPVVVETCGQRIAFVALTCVAPIGWAAVGAHPGLAALRVRTAYEVDARWEQEEPGIAPRVRTWLEDVDLDRARGAVEAAARAADMVVASVHWGVGASRTPSDYQRQLSNVLVAAGAAVVLGGHPPPLQGLEVDDSSLVAYSMGTFVRQQPRPAALRAVYEAMPSAGLLVALDVHREGRLGIDVLPMELGDDDLSALATPARAETIIQDVLSRSDGARIGVGSDAGRLRFDLARKNLHTR